MKNKMRIKILINILVIFFISVSNLSANDVIINAEKVDIKESGNVIIASDSVNIKDGDGIEINGDEAKYNKLTQQVEINGSVVFIDKIKNYKATSNKIVFNRKEKLIYSFGNTNFKFFDKKNQNIQFEIKGQDSSFDQNKKILEINNSVNLIDVENGYNVKSEKVVYDKSKELIQSISRTNLNYKNELLIDTEDLFFDKKSEKIFSDKKTIIKDNFQNQFDLSNFELDINKKIFKAKEMLVTDFEKNLLYLENGYVDLKSNELIGSDFNLKFNKGFFGNPENDPRLVGRYIISNKSGMMMKKSSFTTCKNKKGKCPAWSISADEVKHVKKKKIIEYKKAWLEIYDVPVAYFPYFFHPDPQVERQSGFLFPQFINSSNLGFSTQIPYYNAIDEDKDLTIAPRIYTNNNLFVQTEYRQAFKNSNIVTDFSINKKNETKSHLFSSFIYQLQDTFYEMKIQSVSNKDYLKEYQIKSPLINDYSVLNSTINYELVKDDYSFSSSIDIIEDLTKLDNDRYEYTYPNFEYNKQTLLDGNIFDTLNFKSSGNYKKFNTNVDEASFINDLLWTSNNQIQLNNFETDLSFLVRNVNTYGDLSDKFKQNENYKLLNTFLLNLKYPLFKDTDSGKGYLTPLLSFRYSPNKGIDLKDEERLINFQDLFVLDRIDSTTVEHGGSITLGFEYINLNNLDKERINLGLGVNFKDKIDEDIPLSSSLGQKTSDIIGYSGINITENLALNYNFSLDQNLSETNYSLISTSYNNSKFKTSFEYMEKSNFVGDESYLTNNTQLQLNNQNSIEFETTKNIDKDLTDYYNLIYNYKNDCLQASLIYNKQFYKEDNISSDTNIFFKISFIPFGSVNSPSLND